MIHVVGSDVFLDIKCDTTVIWLPIDWLWLRSWMIWISWVAANKIREDVMTWKRFPHYWPVARGVHRWPMSSELWYLLLLLDWKSCWKGLFIWLPMTIMWRYCIINVSALVLTRRNVKKWLSFCRRHVFLNDNHYILIGILFPRAQSMVHPTEKSWYIT